eukprot:Seg1823.4 transcript_id=Seg1823.4/GoldUCD/mRNA.D3Y31 product="Endothelin-converting enzyme 2" protein_id=Seg1823.4/GoldUCD/D3Y31
MKISMKRLVLFQLICCALLLLLTQNNVNAVAEPSLRTRLEDLDQDEYRDEERERRMKDYENAEDQREPITVYEDDEPSDRSSFEDEKENENTEEQRFEDTQSKYQKKNLCLTSTCVQTAGDILMKMNQKVDPCEDFYGYVCGKFDQNYEPFEDMTRSMSFEILRRRNNYALHKLVKKMPAKSGVKSLDNVKAIYESCMLNGNDPKQGLSNLKKIVAKYRPHGASFNAKKWNFKKALNDMNTNLPTKAFFWLAAGLDSQNPDHYIYSVGQAGLYFSRQYYLSKDAHKTKVRNAYFKMMSNILKDFGYDGKHVKSMAKDIFEFEKKLAKIFIPSTKLRKPDLIETRMTIDELKAITPQVDWTDLFERRLKHAGYKLSDVKKLVLVGKDYFIALGKLIENTKKETLANYMLWKVLSSLGDFCGKKFRDEQFKLMKVYVGKKTETPRWNTCIRTASSWMPFALGRIFVDNRFKSKYAKKEAFNLVTEIKHSFIANLKNVKWMDEATKKKAKSKALAIEQLIGYPMYMLDNAKLDKKYAGLEMSNKDFLGNYLKMHLYALKENVLRLKKHRDRKEWTSAPNIVNAFYSQAYNRIVFPAGILQPTFYHHEYPSPMKYGGIGTVIGHEITHAFDDLGRKYDKNGKLVQWWKAEDIKKFEKKANCIRKQYSSYTIYGKHMNGQLSAGENIADNGGVKIAYAAFRKHLQKHPNTRSLPGLQHLSDDQLFFVAFAKIWCMIEAKAKTLNNIVSDHHSYPKFRVKGALSNSVAFSKAFNCKLGSGMNPRNKCEIW